MPKYNWSQWQSFHYTQEARLLTENCHVSGDLNPTQDMGWDIWSSFRLCAAVKFLVPWPLQTCTVQPVWLKSRTLADNTAQGFPSGFQVLQPFCDNFLITTKSGISNWMQCLHSTAVLSLFTVSMYTHHQLPIAACYFKHNWDQQHEYNILTVQVLYKHVQ
jgi:hypothetical protein